MGVSQSRHRRSVISAQKSNMSQISSKIIEKEVTFTAMQKEVDAAIINNDEKSMRSLASEIAAHMVDLDQLKALNLPQNVRDRVQAVSQNYQLNLAKLKSLFNVGTAAGQETVQAPNYENTTFDGNPDLVNDLMQFDSKTSYCKSSIPPQNSEQIQENIETELALIENELDVLKNQSERVIEDINEYYQIDKGAFYLQVRLKNDIIPGNTSLNNKKLMLINDLIQFRCSLDKKGAELEAQSQIAEQINTLELLADSATEKDMRMLQKQARTLRKAIENTSWDEHFGRKQNELLARLNQIDGTDSVSPMKESEEPLYGNIEILQAIERNGDGIYTNAEIVRKNMTDPSQVNTDVFQLTNKPPLPRPRNYEEKVINNLPKHWQRLNEILDTDGLTEAEEREVAEIQKHAEVAKNLFERKIRQIMEKCEESVDL